jgi:hypothetical protein
MKTDMALVQLKQKTGGKPSKRSRVLVKGIGRDGKPYRYEMTIRSTRSDKFAAEMVAKLHQRLGYSPNQCESLEWKEI